MRYCAISLRYYSSLFALSLSKCLKNGTPYRIRTGVTAVRGPEVLYSGQIVTALLCYLLCYFAAVE